MYTCPFRDFIEGKKQEKKTAILYAASVTYKVTRGAEVGYNKIDGALQANLNASSCRTRDPHDIISIVFCT